MSIIWCGAVLPCPFHVSEFLLWSQILCIDISLNRAYMVLHNEKNNNFYESRKGKYASKRWWIENLYFLHLCDINKYMAFIRKLFWQRHNNSRLDFLFAWIFYSTIIFARLRKDCRARAESRRTFAEIRKFNIAHSRIYLAVTSVEYFTWTRLLWVEGGRVSRAEGRGWRGARPRRGKCETFIASCWTLGLKLSLGNV